MVEPANMLNCLSALYNTIQTLLQDSSGYYWKPRHGSQMHPPFLLLGNLEAGEAPTPFVTASD